METVDTGLWQASDGLYARYEFGLLTWTSLALGLLAVPVAGITGWFVYRLATMQAAKLGSRQPDGAATSA
ncbi:hypothetical protein [Streptomyces hygroscopicus]|uniref:hypothetical protein n=1 Tax=Streptomyces hygroscopicus TaxID=1912 RepID=UPI001FCAB29A|nr:hypothetical protein [Streptomyces hygroscopicus]